MIVYADLLFLLNFAVNFMLLDGAALFAGRARRLPRVLLAAALGALYALAAAMPQLAALRFFAFKLLLAGAMLLVAYGPSAQLPRLAIWFALLSMAFAGVVLLVAALFGTGLYVVGGTALYPVSFSALVLTAGLSYGVLGLVLRRFGRHGAHSDLRPVTICLQGRQLHCTALLDNGNSLRDPLSGQSVFVVEAQSMQRLVPALRGQALTQPDALLVTLADSLPGLRLIPYRAVGVQSGLLLALRSDWVLLGAERRAGAVIAVSPSPVSARGEYQVLAGGE